MKKTLLIIVVLVILAIAGGLYYMFTNLDMLVKQAIEKYGSQATQTAVRVDSVRIKLAEGSAAIGGLTVANPDRFSMPHAFVLGEIATRIDIKALTEEKIVIDEVRVLAPQVFYEVNADKQGNLNVLKDNLGIGAKPAAGTKPGKADAKPLTLTIRKFVFADAALLAKVVPLNNKEYKLTLPTLQLANLSGTPEQISRQVLDQLIDHARKTIKEKGIDAELDKLKAEAREKLDAEKAGLKEKADTKLEAEKQKAEDKLKNLLGR